MGETTSSLGLYKPTVDTETGWGDLVNANCDALETKVGKSANLTISSLNMTTAVTAGTVCIANLTVNTISVDYFV